MRTLRAAIGRIVLVGVLLAGGYAALLCVPQPIFRFSVHAANLTLYSDRPISEAAGRHVLELAGQKLARSSLYFAGERHNIFICNSGWRQKLMFNKNYAAGGVAQYPATWNVFLRAARIDDNRLLSPSGNPVAGDRTLDYFVAHEVTHQLTGRALGPIGFYRLPQWVREGYADYVGKSSFDYQEARRAFLAGAPQMDWKRSGLYSRFHLRVAYLLDRQHWSVQRLLENPPSEAAVDAAIREEQP
jgi:hypothetical protein